MKKAPLAERVFAVVMTFLIVTMYNPLVAVAAEYVQKDALAQSGIEVMDLSDENVTTVDGQVLPAETGGESAADGEDEGEPAPSADEPEATSDEPAEAAESEIAPTSGYSAMANSVKIGQYATVEGGSQGVDWEYNGGTQVLTVLTKTPITVRRAYTGAQGKTTISVESKEGADITLIDPWLDGRNLSDEMIKHGADFDYLDGTDEYGRQKYRFLTRKDLAERYDCDEFLKEGRAGVDITSKVEGETFIRIVNSKGDFTGDTAPRIFGGNDRAAIEKNNGAGKVTVTCSGRAVVYGGLGDREDCSGPAAIGTKANVKCENLTVQCLNGNDLAHNGHLVAMNTQDLNTGTNDFGAAIGAGSGADVENLTVIGPDNIDFWKDYDEDPYVVYNCVYPESAAGSAIGAGYGAKGKSTITLKGRIQPITYAFYDGHEGAAIGVSYEDAMKNGASADITIEDGWVSPQTWYGVAIGCGKEGTFELKRGVIEADAGIMTDSSHQHPENVMGLQAKTVKVGAGLKPNEIGTQHDYLGYVSSDTSFGVECDDFTIYQGTMNIFASMFLSSAFENGQGIHCSKLTVGDKVEGRDGTQVDGQADLYFSSGILMENDGSIDVTNSKLMSLTSGNSNTKTYANAINVERFGSADFTLTDSSCDLLGGADMGDGTITLNGNSYLRGYSGYLVGAGNESVFTDVYTAEEIKLNGGKIIGYYDKNGDRFRPASAETEGYENLELKSPERTFAPGMDENGTRELPERTGEVDRIASKSSSFTSSSTYEPAAQEHYVFSVAPTFDPGFEHISMGELTAPGSGKHELKEIDEDDDTRWTDYTYVEIGPKAELPTDTEAVKDRTIQLDTAGATTHKLNVHDLSITAEPAQTTLSYTSSDPDVVSIDETTGIATVHHVGAALITVAPAGIYVGNSVSFTVTVTRGAGSGTVSLDGWVYGETPKRPVITCETNGTDQVKYAFSPATEPKKFGEEGEFDDLAPKLSGGTWYIKAIFPATPDHDKVEAVSAEPFEIIPANASINPESQTLTVVSSDKDGTTLRVNVTGDGALKAKSGDGNTAEVVGDPTEKTQGQSGSSVHIWEVTVKGKTTGQTTLTLSCEATKNYNAVEKSVKLDVKTNQTRMTKDPTVKSGVRYNGSQQNLYNDLNQAYVNIDGVAYATEPGTYEVTLTPKGGYAWRDGGTESRSMSSSIDEANMSDCVISDIPAQTYHYAGVTPKPTVTLKGYNNASYTLQEGVDYTLSYENNKRVGWGTVVITTIEPSMHFQGSASKNFQIKQIDLFAKENIEYFAYTRPYELTYTGQAQTSPFSAWWKADANDKSTKPVYLEKDKDFTVKYDTPNSTDVGTYKMEVHAKGNYTDSYTQADKVNNGYFNYKIVPADLADLEVRGVKTLTRTGSPLKQDENSIQLIAKSDGKEYVIPSSDYVISYEDNTNAGMAKMIIKPNPSKTFTGDEGAKITNLKGEKTVEFKIVNSMNELTVVNPPAEQHFTYDGTERVGVPTNPGYTAVGDTTATLPGSYTAWVTPNDDYAWDNGGDVSPKRIDWSIEKINLAETTIANVNDAVYTGKPIQQNPKLTLGSYALDFNELELTYVNNVLPSTEGAKAKVVITPAQHFQDKGDGKLGDLKDAKHNPYYTGSTSMEFTIEPSESTVDSAIFASAQIKDGRALSTSVSLAYNGDGTLQVTSDDPKIATATITPLSGSKAASGTATATLATDSNQSVTGSKPNYTIDIMPRGRGTTVLRVAAPKTQNYEAREQLIYVTVDEFYLGKRVVGQPQGLALAYNGRQQVGVAYDSDGIEFVEGANSATQTHAATQPGSYTALVQPKVGYVWADGHGSEVREIPWSIIGDAESRGSITSDAKDTTVNLSEGQNAFTYHVSYVNVADVVAKSSNENVAEVALTKPDGTVNTADLTITPKAVGSTLITVSADGEVEGVEPVTFYVNVVENAAVVNVVEAPKPVSEALTFTGSLQVGVRSGEGYVLSGPSVPEQGEYAGSSVGLNAGTYWVKATPAENYAWDEFGDT